MASEAVDQTPAVTEPVPEEPKLPPLSSADFKTYNRMSESMTWFHDRFRAQWNELYAAASATSSSVPASRLIRLGLTFTTHLTMHHDIEEAHIFPLLARKMPQFKKSSKEGPIEQHRQIHRGLDKLAEYLSECKEGERSFQRSEVKELMDSFGTVLWQHLDDEVIELGAENMRKYWTKADMARMPM